MSENNNVKNKKTSILVIIIVVLLLIIIGLILIMAKSIFDNDKYDDFEDQLEDVAERYVLTNNYDLSSLASSIVIKDLSSMIDNDLKNKCDGYVLIRKENDDDGYEYDYDAYINCGNYKTKGYDSINANKTVLNLNDNTSNQNNNTQNQDKNACPEYVTNLKDDDIVSKYSYKAIGDESDGGIELTLYNNNIMYIYSGWGMTQTDGFYGQYSIEGNKLTIKRLIYGYKQSDGTYYCSNSDNIPNYNDTIFTINSENSISTTSYEPYQEKDGELYGDMTYPITLKKVK